MEKNVRNLPIEPKAIAKRLQELEKEWDADRVCEFNSSLMALSGTLLGKIITKKCSSLPVLTTTLLAYETTPYWNPPIALFRNLGYRSQQEIQEEKEVLKSLLNDSDDFSFDAVA